MEKRVSLEAPLGATEVLLHTCCAPCSSAIIECMLANAIRPVLFFFNPNIYPLAEYEKRKAECTRHARSLGLRIIDGDYDHTGWLDQVKGMEAEPERGSRCLSCFTFRLRETARVASEQGYPVFTTTLASSRWKNLAQIHAAGRNAASAYPGIVFWEQNWRKGGLSERRNELVAHHQFYNQTYCGCEFGMRRHADTEEKPVL